MAGRDDDGEPWVTEEIRPPGGGTDPTDGDWPLRQGDPGGPGVATGAPGAVAPSRAWDAAARRRRRQTLTFLVCFLLILLVGVLALAAYFDKLSLPIGSGRPEPLPTCAQTAPTPPAPADTVVRVLNASDRRGLAAAVAGELGKRGFDVTGAPSNDPARTRVTTMAVLRHGPAGALAAQTVAGAVAGEVTLVVDERQGADVDLVLGQTFKLAPAAAPTPSAQAPSPTCRPASAPSASTPSAS